MIPKEFVPLKQYPGYFINKNGDIGSSRKPKFSVRVPCTDKKGYLIMIFWYKDKPQGKSIHRLLAETFIPRVKGKNYVNHKDGNVKNNSLANLEWCTNSENLLHRFHILKRPISEKSKQVKLTYANVSEIKRLGKLGVTQKELAKRFNVTESNIYKTIAGIQWRYIE